MRTVHRFVTAIAVLFVLYVALTGITVQILDLQSLLGHVPATTPNLQSLREGHDGPPNFQVIDDLDYSAPPLPAGFDFDAALSTVVKSERAVTAGAPMSFIELRMKDGKPVGQINSRGKLLVFDAIGGAVLAGPDTAKPAVYPQKNHPSFRSTMKDLHRFLWYGPWGTPFDFLFGLSMCTILFTGLVMYFRLLAARARTGRKSPYWSAGGFWRTLHRVIAVTSSVFLTIIVVSGTSLSVGSLGVTLHTLLNIPRTGLTADMSSPLSDAELPAMLHTTLAAYRAENPGDPIKVLRLRYFAGMKQGVVIAGGEETRQLVFNAATGRHASETEPGYPDTGQTFGWQEDQIAKQIHRGDIIGLTGRWISLLTGLSLVFLIVSGTAMYFDMWNRRRRAGRSGPFWL